MTSDLTLTADGVLSALSQGLQPTGFIPMVDYTSRMLFGTSASQALTATTKLPYVVGMGGNDTITGSTGNDLLVGDYFDKVFLNAILNANEPTPPAYNATLVGNDVLNGGAGNDSLYADLGNDTLDGGSGDDEFRVYVPDMGKDVILGGTGQDILILSDLWHLGLTGIQTSRLILDAAASIETLQMGSIALLGTTGNDRIDLSGVTTIAAFFPGITPAVQLQGGNDVYIAGATPLRVDGGGGLDTLTGGTGSDTLDGGTGADRLIGGAGNDAYFVDVTGDVIVETEDGGIDQITATGPRITMDAWVENLYVLWEGAFNGTGNAQDNLMTGTLFDDTLNGSGGNDTLQGTEGHDSLLGGSGNDVLSVAQFYSGTIPGSATLDGGTGNDTLSGTSGGELMYGGDGADLLSGNAGDDQLYAGAGNDRITAGKGHSTIYGGDGNDSISSGLAGCLVFGDGGNDTFTGGSSSTDTVNGGLGNDVYQVYSTKEVQSEAGGGGIDTIVFAVYTKNYTLADGFENLDFHGEAFGTLTGNAAGNTITVTNMSSRLVGLDGNDTLICAGVGGSTLEGGLGNDTLTGGASVDYFVFNTAPGPGNVDTITNFKVHLPGTGGDYFKLENSGAGLYQALPAGALSDAAFKTLGPGVTVDADDRILYDPATGKLFYDSDGNGAAAKILFAIVTPGLLLTSADFQII